MDWKWQIVAALAMIMIEASYVAQIARLYRTKKAEDLSVFFPLLNAGGRALGMLYTGLSGDIVLALGFMAGIILRGTLLFQVWYYKRAAEREANGVSQPSSLPVWSRLRNWYSTTTGRAPATVHTYELTRLVTPSSGSDLLLRPALCHADSCQPERHSLTTPQNNQ